MATRYAAPTSTHARRRFRERLKLPVRAMRRMTREALLYGADPHELDLPLRLKLESAIKRNDPTQEKFVKVYRGHVFVFAKDRQSLVTVIQLHLDGYEDNEDDEH